MRQSQARRVIDPLPAQHQATVPREEEELGAPDPHIYSVGALAYKQLRETGRNQSIVVTGISGAGKTEANKYLLKYLCWRANETNGEEPEMAKVVLSSTPVFEAFGNATTVSCPTRPISSLSHSVPIYLPAYGTFSPRMLAAAPPLRS